MAEGVAPSTSGNIGFVGESSTPATSCLMLIDTNVRSALRSWASAFTCGSPLTVPEIAVTVCDRRLKNECPVVVCAAGVECVLERLVWLSWCPGGCAMPTAISAAPIPRGPCICRNSRRFRRVTASPPHERPGFLALYDAASAACDTAPLNTVAFV